MKIFFFLTLFAFSAQAADINIHNLYVWPALDKKHPTTFYFDIKNNSNNIDYLIGAEIIDHPEVNISINKTVIEQNIARIIYIDQLAIPANSEIKLAPIGIYLICKNFPSEIKDLKMKLIFKKQVIIINFNQILTKPS